MLDSYKPGALDSNTMAPPNAPLPSIGLNLSEGSSLNRFKKGRPKYTPKEKNVERLCKICNIMCSSLATYNDHIKGKKHQKKEREARTYSCEVCSIFCVTADEQREHFETEMHAESVKVQEYLMSQAEEKKKQKNQLVASEAGLTNSELEDIRNSQGDEYKWWSCDICCVKSNSEDMYQRHLDSKKHRSRFHDVEENKKKLIKEFSCGVCNYICTSAEERDVHVTSDEHLKIAFTTEKSHDMLESIADSDEPMVTPIRAADNTIWYPCALCDCKMNSLDNYKTHINSKKHKAKQSGQLTRTKKEIKKKYTSEFLRENYNRFIMSSSDLSSKITGDPGSFCAKCETQFETPTKLEEHFLTPEHKNHQPIKRKYRFDQDVPITKKQAAKPKSEINLENYGYGKPELHIAAEPVRKVTSSFVSSAPTTYTYLQQKQPTAYSYGNTTTPTMPTYSNNYVQPTTSYPIPYQPQTYSTPTVQVPAAPVAPVSYNNYAYPAYNNTPAVPVQQPHPNVPYGAVPPPPPFPYQ